MKEVKLNPLDTSWVVTESRATPNHVGGLLQFELPNGAPREFMRDMMLDFRSHRKLQSPWNRRLKQAFSKSPIASWVEDTDIDLEYHVRHAALPWPGGERELGELVGRLHSTPLDLQRPPWECTLIEGLENKRFAIFFKMHHSLIDGVSGIKLLQRAMSHDRRKSLTMPPFWASSNASPAAGETAQKPKSRHTHEEPHPSVAEVLGASYGLLRGQLLSTLPRLASAFGSFIKSYSNPEHELAIPFLDSPQSVLNGRVREKRRFATQQFSMERLRAISQLTHCTLNDVVLAICSGSLRRFLLEMNALPDQSLTAGVPISVRPKDDQGQGNAISFIVVNLGSNIPYATERLRVIKDSAHLAKQHVQNLPREAMLQYTMLLMAPTLVTLLSGTGGRTRPMFNITISNVPGPEKPLYFRGAKMMASYPASIVTHGQALNITCQSYAGMMDFGFTGCHSSVPSLQRMAVYAEESLLELESELGIANTPKRKPARKTRKPAASS